MARDLHHNTPLWPGILQDGWLDGPDHSQSAGHVEPFGLLDVLCHSIQIRSLVSFPLSNLAVAHGPIKEGYDPGACLPWFFLEP